MAMASIRTSFEENNIDGDAHPDSKTAYTTFSAEDSMDQKKIDIDGGDPVHHHTDHDEVKEQEVWHGVFESRCCKCIDITTTVVIIALVWMMMTLPTVLYIDTVVQTGDTEASSGTMDIYDGTNATCVLYKGNDSAYCTPYLQQYTKCLKDSISEDAAVDVYISGPHDQTVIGEVDEMIKKQRNYLDLRPQCRSSLEPLICLCYIHLCDNATDIGPSEKQYKHISDVCDKEFKTYNVDELTKYLPKCMPIAKQSPLDGKNCITRSHSNNIQAVNCNKGFFYKATKGCKPECNVWLPYSRAKLFFTNILTIFPAVVGTICGVAVLLFSWANRQKLWRYPSIFVVYQTIPTVVLAVLVLIGFFARKKLFCRSRDLIESFEMPTTFCFITGITLYYIVMQLLLWWLWHTIAVFWTVTWPFHARKFNSSRKNRYLHFIFVFASLILPIVPVLTVIFTPGKFTITHFPTFVCTGKNIHTNFWAVLFPMSLLLAIGTTLLVFILRIIIKKHCLSKIYKMRVILNWTVEIKVLLVLCYYVILGSAVLTIFMKGLSDITSKKNVIVDYFRCESEGLLPNSNKSRCPEQEKSIQATLDPISTSVAIFILGFLPVVNLVYFVKCRELKRKLKTYVQREANGATRYLPYVANVNYEHKSITLHHSPLTGHTNTVNTEPLITSQN